MGYFKRRSCNNLSPEKGVKWTDGVEFTAEDVMFGYKTIIDDKTPTAYSEDYKQVKKAEMPDKYTFRVTYEKPFAPALSSWGSLPVLPRHLLAGKDITKSEWAETLLVWDRSSW